MIREGLIGVIIVVMVMVVVVVVVVVITPLLVVVVVMMIMAPPPIVIVMVMMMVGPILSQLRLGVWLARFIGARRRPQLIGGFEERDRVRDRLQQLGVGGRAQDFSDAFRRRRVHRAHRRQRGDRAYKTYDLLVHFSLHQNWPAGS
jgi:hypothetical protein